MGPTEEAVGPVRIEPVLHVPVALDSLVVRRRGEAQDDLSGACAEQEQGEEDGHVAEEEA